MVRAWERATAGRDILGVPKIERCPISVSLCSPERGADGTDQWIGTCNCLKKRTLKPRVEMNTEPDQYHQGEFRLRSPNTNAEVASFFSFLFVRPPLGVCAERFGRERTSFSPL
jgi:hypothetical protein